MRERAEPMPNITISLDKLVCIMPGDVAGTRAEPYLLNYFFELDAPFVQDPNPPTQGYTGSALVYSPSVPNIGNLGTASMGRGDAVNIPATIGRRTALLSPVLPAENRRVGAFGVISVLMEHDAFSEAQVESVRVTVRAMIQSQLNNLILSRPETQLLQPAAAVRPSAFLKGDIEAAVASTLNVSWGRLLSLSMNNQMMNQTPMSWWEGLASFIHPDDMIGYDVFMVNAGELTPEPDRTLEFEAEFRSKGSWKLFGHMFQTP